MLSSAKTGDTIVTVDDLGNAIAMFTGSSPTDLARACVDLCVFQLMFPRSGHCVGSKEFIERLPLSRLVRLRSLIRHELHVENRPRIVCALCGDPLNIAALAMRAGGHSFYFSHVRDVVGDKRDCPYRALRPDQSQIELWKYHGQRESEAHRQIKARIARSLACQSDIRDIVEERVWVGPNGWRKPDVSATWLKNSDGPLSLAFEAQLSTTFISTIVKRQEFYRTQGAALIWVLRGFDPADRRMTTEDILFSNNANVLVVNERTEAASRAAGKFVVEVHWYEPVLNGEALSGTWRLANVNFDDLMIDPVRQQCFYFDAAKRERQLRNHLAVKIAEEEASRQRIEIQQISERFTSIVLETPLLPRMPDNLEDLPPYAGRKEWYSLRQRFAAVGVEIPYHPTEDWRLVMIVRAIMSAKTGRPVGWNYSKLVQVAHLLAEQYKYAMWPFAMAIRTYGRKQQLEAEDGKGRWRLRSHSIWAAIKAGDPKYAIPTDWSAVLALVFPEVFQSENEGTQPPLADHGMPGSAIELVQQ